MFLVIMIALVIVVGGGMVILLLAGGMGKGKARTPRVRYRYSDGAQNAAGNARRAAAAAPQDSRSDEKPGKRANVFTEELTSAGVDEQVLKWASPGIAGKLIRGKAPDPSEFGKNIGKKPLKIDRRFAGGPQAEESEDDAGNAEES